VLVEGVFEHGGEAGAEARRLVSRAHWRSDRAVEIPAFVGVLVTGAIMAGSVPMTPLLATKIGFGLAAILVNVYCVLLVFRRLKAAEAGDDAAWAAIDARQHRFGAVVFATMLITLAIGGYLFANG
jgi:uncharacterized membrane protein YdfJ with MMPL/SSD domain